jgi:hypothetical protein
MILSIDAEKACDKIQHAFMIKALKKLGKEGMYLNIIMAMYKKLIANIILNGEKLKNICTKVRNKTSVPTFPTLIQYNFRIPNQSNKGKK